MIELINFIDLTLEEKKMILAWRNHYTVKQWMYNTDDISTEGHFSFINTLQNIDDKLYFLVKQEKEYLGVIDFTNITKKICNFGLYTNIDLKGIGKILLKTIQIYSFGTLKVTTLKAEVFKENVKAISLYKQFKFIEIDTKIVNNKEVICMELKNENRQV